MAFGRLRLKPDFFTTTITGNAFDSGNPAVAVVDAAVVNGRYSLRASPRPYERVTPYEALQGVTVNAAYEIFEEQSKRTLEVGKLADLVILSGNPMTLARESLLKLRVDATIKEGAVFWQRKR